MHNIWTFLLQTATVSLVAALLLAVKALLADKLSLRWQYGVWCVLALRILIPVAPARQILLPVNLWLETLKAAAERQLHSAYSATYTPIGAGAPFPWLTAAPASITDWLLIIYVAGVAFSVAWYTMSYLRLRLSLRHGYQVSEDLSNRIAEICKSLKLRPCKAIEVEGLTSAFVCGILKPVIVLPAGRETDDKILLHELLHLKHWDALQNLFWCALRALHWCNPFVHWVFDRIGNDMESLCDQRMLERLEGEDRRQYGVILLDMVNERYARAPLTSSISNGGRNISRRIAAIVRFKKYPKGMALVSVCIILVLLSPTIAGSANAISNQVYRPGPVTELDAAMAAVRLNRCSTPAAALDAYAKGLIYENGVYIAAASPLSEHAALEAQMRRHVAEDGWVAYHLDSGSELEYIDRSSGFTIYDFVPQPDGGYAATLTFAVSSFLSDDGTLMTNKDGELVCGGVIVPVQVTYSPTDGWTVNESGERSIYIGRYDQMRYPDSVLPWIRQHKAVGKSGTVAVSYHTTYYVENAQGQNSNWSGDVLFGSSSYTNENISFDAEFEYAHISYYVEYEHNFSSPLGSPVDRVTVQAAHFAEDEDPSEIVFEPVTYTSNASGSSNQGTSWANMPVSEGWDGGIFMGSGGSDYGLEDGVAKLPHCCVIEVAWDGKAVERFVFTEEEPHNGN